MKKLLTIALAAVLCLSALAIMGFNETISDLDPAVPGTNYSTILTGGNYEYYDVTVTDQDGNSVTGWQIIYDGNNDFTQGKWTLSGPVPDDYTSMQVMITQASAEPVIYYLTAANSGGGVPGIIAPEDVILIPQVNVPEHRLPEYIQNRDVEEGTPDLTLE